MLRLFRASLLPAVLVCASPLALHADTVTGYNYQIVTADANGVPGSGFTVTGSLAGTADPYNSTALDVTALSSNGSVSSYTFTGVVSPGTTNSQHPGVFDGVTFDNVLSPDGVSYASTDGFLLYLNSVVGTSLAHVYYTGVTLQNPGGYEVDVRDPGDPSAFTPFGVESFTITPESSPVPEPSTLLLLGTGAIGAVGTLVRRRRL